MKKQILKIFIFLGLIFLLINTNFNEIYTSLAKFPKRILILLILLQILTINLLAIQWRQTMDLIDIKRSFFMVLKMNLKGNIIDSITPGSKVGGELTRIHYIRKKLNIGKSESITIFLIQKLISIFSFIILLILSILYLIFKDKNIYEKNYYLLLFILSLIISFIYLFINKPKLIYNMFIFNKNNSNKSKDERFNKFIEISERINKTKLIKNIFLGITIWLIYAIKLIILTRVFNKDISIFKISAVTYFTYLIGMLPLLPGSIGSFEASMTSMLIILGVNAEESLLISIIFRFVTFWFEFIFSLFVLGLEKIRKKKVKGGKYA